MRKTITMPLVVVGASALLALGFAVAAFGSSSSANGPVSTSETTTTKSTTETTPTSTTEMVKSTRYAAALGAKAEVPRPVGVHAGAGGAFTVTLSHKADKYTASWKLTFHNLSGKAVAAHVHKGMVGKAGPVLLSLCGPCKSGAHGSAAVPASAATAMQKGLAYVNVHTAKNANGEIRGQVKKK